MAENKNKSKQERDKNPGEGTFTRDSIERNQDFSNEQNPDIEDGSEANTHSDNDTENIADQYHSATETGEFQERQNKQKEKENHPSKEYYDQDGHQPSAADLKKMEREKKAKQ